MKLFNTGLVVAFAVAACSSTDERVARNTNVDPSTVTEAAQGTPSVDHPSVAGVDANTRTITTPHDPTAVQHPSVGDNLYGLSLADREKMVGARVTLVNAKVQHVNGDYDFWVGPTLAKSVPVVLKRERIGLDRERKVIVRKGQNLTITGTIQRASDVVDELKINKNARTKFLGQGTYFSADKVEGAGHSHLGE